MTPEPKRAKPSTPAPKAKPSERESQSLTLTASEIARWEGRQGRGPASPFIPQSGKPIGLTVWVPNRFLLASLGCPTESNGKTTGSRPFVHSGPPAFFPAVKRGILGICGTAPRVTLCDLVLRCVTASRLCVSTASVVRRLQRYPHSVTHVTRLPFSDKRRKGRFLCSLLFCRLIGLRCR
jgi:hypothetical protein